MATTTTIKLSNTTFLETAPIGTVIGILSLEDAAPGEKASYSDDSDFFEIRRNAAGEFELVTKVEGKDFFDFENSALKEFTIQISHENFSTGEIIEFPFTISVMDAPERLTGTAKNDTLFGTANADSIDGGAGNDKIYGLDGDDTINGGAGKDILYGGAGRDSFVFDSKVKKGHFDQIKDFNANEDTITLDLDAFSSFKLKPSKKADGASHKKGLDDKGGVKAEKPKSFDKVFKKGKIEKKFFKIGSEAKDGNDYLVYNQKKGILTFDADGVGGSKGIEILKLKPGTYLSTADIIFI
jgi:serralysin